MKILFITPKIPYPPTDGHKKSMWGVIKYLSLLGHRIEIISYRQNDNPDVFKNEIEKYAKLHVIDVQTNNSIVGVIINLFSPVPYNISKYKRKELKLYLNKFLKNNDVDIIHVVNSHMGFVIDFIREMSDVPVVLRQENLEMMIMKRFYETQKNILLKAFAFIQFKKFIKYEPSLCAKYDLTIMMSDEDEKQLKIFKDKINTTIIPLGVEDELLSLSKDEKEPYSIAHIGSLKWYPNSDGFKWFVDEIFEKILEKYPASKLYVYGGGLPVGYYFPPKIKNNIIVKGFVDDVWSELKNKSIAVIPLRIGSGIRVKILEMLAAQINVISTSLGIEGLDLKDGRDLLVADSARDFAEKIISFFSGNYDSNKLSESGRAFVEKNYSWTDIALRFEDAYKKITYIKK